MIVSTGRGGVRIRVWIDEPPVFNSNHSVEVSPQLLFDNQVEPTVAGRRATIEFCYFPGGRAEYGLLGATYLQRSVNQLVIEIPILHGSGKPIEGSLNIRPDKTLAGIPAWAGESVLAGILEANAANEPLSGRLAVDAAVYGEAYSSPALLKHLASRLIVLFQQGLYVRSDEELLSTILQPLYKKQA